MHVVDLFEHDALEAVLHLQSFPKQPEEAANVRMGRAQRSCEKEQDNGEQHDSRGEQRSDKSEGDKEEDNNQRARRIAPHID